MKTVVIACALTLVTSSAFAELPKDEVKRLNSAGVIINELRNSPEKGIPEQLWEKAECVVVIPGMKKAAFVFGGEYGSGVMSCRRPNGWSSPGEPLPGWLKPAVTRPGCWLPWTGPKPCAARTWS
jgi:lipid-binding SYLF domain-containing protein